MVNAGLVHNTKLYQKLNRASSESYKLYIVIPVLPNKKLLLINSFFPNIWVKCYKTPKFLKSFIQFCDLLSSSYFV